VNARADSLPDVVRTARKGYAAWSRRVQFAAARPGRGGKLILGLAVSPEAHPRLAARGSEPWSERLAARLDLAAAAAVDDELAALLETAWDKA
jgi:hypothetical protein